MPRPSARLPRVMLGVLALAYPVLVYIGLTRWSARSVGLVLVFAVLSMLVLRTRGMQRSGLRQAVLPVLPALVLGGCAAAIGDGRFLLWVPVLISGLLLASFGASLRAGSIPWVERIARLQDPELPPAGIRHCRQVTLAWCMFFAANGAVAAGLAVWGPFAWWAAYTGGIAYGLMGLMFAGEFLIRRVRLREVV